MSTFAAKAAEAAYRWLPHVGQELALAAVALRLVRRRYGSRFRTALRDAEARLHLSFSDVSRNTSELLAAALTDAYRTHPFVRAFFTRAGLVEKDLSRPDALSRLPVTGKADARAFAREAVKSSRRLGRFTVAHTSGSTGAGLVFPVSDVAEAIQWATWWRYRRAHGIQLDDVCLYFGGRSIVPIQQSQPPFWRFVRPTRQLMYSAYHFNDNTARAYLASINSSGAQWVHGYPSFLATVAAASIKLSVPLRRFRWVTTGAESLRPWQAAAITRAFGVPPIEHYGQAEGVANASQYGPECLTVDEDYSVVELLPTPDGDATAIVGTALWNRHFPLIRYDTGDLCTPLARTATDGSWRRLVAIDGRVEDAVIGTGGTIVGRLDHAFKDAVSIEAAQIIQRDYSSIDVYIVPGPQYAPSDGDKVRTELAKRLGAGIEIRTHTVSSLPCTSGTKVRFVLSEVRTPRDA
jgi:phenylacetate-CoA ligase